MKKPKTWFGKLIAYFSKAFDSNKPTRLKVIEIVNFLKRAVESSTADLLADFIPGDVDDITLRVLRSWLPAILKDLELANKRALDDEIILRQGIQNLKNLDKESRGYIYSLVAGKLYQNFTGKTQYEATQEIQEEYRNNVA